jgi:hypothetical protein
MACGAYTIDGTALSADALVAIVREALANPRETERLGMLQAEETFKLDRWHNRIKTIDQWRTSLS